MASTKNGDSSFYDDTDNLKKLCDFLRSKHGPPVREATLMEKRVHYIKGEKLVTFMAEPKKATKWPSKLPKFATRQEAVSVCKELVKQSFLLRSEKQGKGELGVSRLRDFDEGGYYTWVYEGDKTFSNLMTGGIILGFLACVCFPIWPYFLRVWVWYLSVTFILFIFGLTTLRGFVFLCVWLLGWEFWFLPNLFEESLGFFESFVPAYSIERTKPGQLYYRVGVGVAFFSFCYWAVTQPSEFDGFVSAQGDFLKDLYAGTLLSDMSQEDKENIDKPKMQSLEDLLKDLDSEDEVPDPLAEMDEEEKLDSMLDNLVDEEEDIISEEE